MNFSEGILKLVHEEVVGLLAESLELWWRRLGFLERNDDLGVRVRDICVHMELLLRAKVSKIHTFLRGRRPGLAWLLMPLVNHVKAAVS
eukprot:CAMPEP_0172600930 /NCGR_PEP_ID=MMETSP1068-20121228/21090_1 /TAXON_ID=35684 /ORGANISM="Pseudopedinella elastica, Strain CCMP716" /LENGTH=88 /DNA_ID=CAMNT_0013401751 /DNA_START=363 /DNA_END=629 /DNA_ORIENTATION=+